MSAILPVLKAIDAAASRRALRIHTENLNPSSREFDTHAEGISTLVASAAKSATAKTKTSDIGFAIRDMLDMLDHGQFCRFTHRALNGGWDETGVDSIARVDAHDPSNLRIETASGQRFTVRIFAS